jgi:hypothetical protein
MKMLSKLTTSKVLLSAALATLIVGTATAAQQSSASADVIQPAAVVTIISCVNNTSGAIRIVGSSTVCKSTEHKVEWNQKGARGPKGSQGLQGQPGPAGAQGPPGISVGYSSIVTQGSTLAAFPGALIAQSNPVATTGTYFVSASAFLDIESSDNTGAFCYDTIASSGAPFQFSGSLTNGLQPASITDVIRVSAGDSFQLFCSGSDSSEFLNGGLTAILINSVSDSSKKPRHPRSLHLPGVPTQHQ